MFDVNTISKPPRRLRYQRYKLSDLDKQNLYEERPDLDPEGTLEDPLISTSNKFGSFKSSNGKLIISEDMSRIPSYRGGNSLLTQGKFSLPKVVRSFMTTGLILSILCSMQSHL